MTVAIDASETAAPTGDDAVPPQAAESAPAVDAQGSTTDEEAGNFWQPPADTAAAPEQSEELEEEAENDSAEVPEAITRDAHEFGVYARTGGWAFALKVARSVRPGGQPAGETSKVSARRFAELAGCSADRVMRFYKAWDRAADDGIVPQFESLAPGAEIELPEADVWLSYYVSRSSGTSVRGQAITEAAEAEGIRPTKALEVAENPTALRAAILADPGTAEAARKALMDRLGEDPVLRTGMARDIVRTDDLKKAVAEESKTGGQLDYVRKIVEEGQVKTPAGQKIEAPRSLREEAERHLSLIDELDEDEETGEWAQEAYDSVRTLVAETVEKDPELRVQERRAKFYSSLQKATKAFEELTFDDVDGEEMDDIVEDDMLQRLEELQQAISTCISALQKAKSGS
ncbi:hypothetical protein ACN2WE_03035 [Streptomyces sp. cg28]|uniref:hypothetical protein n=1 Tax=unclassified Streptomyces TaxID=2593676 RepID=UPI000DB93F19|nr:hypothetical protein [Streptomyces sp. PsTaAH-137]MYT75177.1 hypothetical protein [Streptomyces sp. SID8367]RAJ77133.1 hypothetical protein K377_05891 [Streptomyces sp. PsTaAH-137]